MYYFLKKFYLKFLVNNNITIFILEYYTCGNKIIRTFQKKIIIIIRREKNRKPDFLQSLLLEMLLHRR